MKPLFIDGWAWWPPAPGAPLPAPPLLGANERRRAPESVRVALHVAAQAVEQAAVDPATLASVFTSAHGDLAVVDALCRTLAEAPALLSPTRFHHSVHNAASGYWAIATGSRAPSSALAAFDASFANGLLEAACQCVADERALLLVGVDTEARGALASVNRSRGTLGAALVLTPEASGRSSWRIDLECEPGTAAPAPPPKRSDLAANALADALPLFEALAGGSDARCMLALGPALKLAVRLVKL